MRQSYALPHIAVLGSMWHSTVLTVVVNDVVGCWIVQNCCRRWQHYLDDEFRWQHLDYCEVEMHMI